jgi:hypothetical protein
MSPALPPSRISSITRTISISRQTGEKVYSCAYDPEQHLQDAEQKSARLLGMPLH